MSRTRKSYQAVDLSALIGTVVSLTAFVMMGWVVHNMMWQPKARLEIESLSPEKPTDPEAPSSPRKSNSNLKLIA